MPTNKKITYLLGAGASYNALPLVKEMPEEFEKMITYIKQYEANIFPENNNTFAKTTSIIAEIQEHYSIDTLARKYNLAKENLQYDRIKNIITSLIIFKNLHFEKSFQHFSGIEEKRVFQKTDNRYDAFFSALLNDELELPENIKILSWNYDFQIEKAFNFYLKAPSFKDAGNKLGIRYISTKKDIIGPIIKLNGTGLFLDRNSRKPILYKKYNDEIHNLFVRALCDDMDGNVFPAIKFAWEVDSHIASSNRKRAKEIIQESDYVVVIGYSFPIFNREVDIELFKGFKTAKKIYIQDTPERVNQIKNQLEAIKSGLSKNCELQTDLDQFLIPNEYWNEPPRPTLKATSF